MKEVIHRLNSHLCMSRSFAMAILLGDGIELFLPLFGVINGIQVLQVDLGLEPRV